MNKQKIRIILLLLLPALPCLHPQVGQAQVRATETDLLRIRQQYEMGTEQINAIIRNLSAASTHNQSPTAKAVWDALQAQSISLSSGLGISINQNGGTYTISNAAPDQMVAITGAGLTAITGTYPNFTAMTTLNTTGRFTGAGTALSPLELAQMGAANGQVLKWNGTAWTPSADIDTNTDAQTLSITGQALSISGGNSVTLPVISVAGSTGITATTTAGAVALSVADQSATNELQNLSVASGNLNISGGTGVSVLSVAPVQFVAGSTGVSVSNTGGTFTVTNTAPDQTVTLTGAGLTAVSGTYPNFTATTTLNTTARLTGSGTVASPLDFAAQGATTGQVLKWNGTAWSPQNEVGNFGQYNYLGDRTDFNAASTPLGWSAVEGYYYQSYNTPVPGSNWQWYQQRVSLGTNTPGWYLDFAIPRTAFTNRVYLYFRDVSPFAFYPWQKMAAGWADAADVANTASTLVQMGATTGQVLKWNGTAWGPSADIDTNTDAQNLSVTSGNLNISGGTGVPILSVAPVQNVAAGTGITVSNTGGTYTVANTGDTNPADDLTTASTAGGDMSGLFSNLQINAGVVGTLELTDAAVTAAKLAHMGAATDQVLKWNGTTWVPRNEVGNFGQLYGLYPRDFNSPTTPLGWNAVDAYYSPPQNAPESRQLQWYHSRMSLGGLAGYGVDFAFARPAMVDKLYFYFRDMDAYQFAAWKKLSAGYADEAGTVIDGAITAQKLAQMGATNGQVLKWNGTAWTPAADIDTNTDAQTLSLTGQALAISGGNSVTLPVISVAGSTGITATTTAGAVTLSVADQSATNELQTIAQSGTTVTLSGGGGSISIPVLFVGSGTGISVSNSLGTFTVTNTGDTNSADDITTTSSAGGDVSGTFSNLQLVANAVSTTELANASVTATKLAGMGAANGQVLRFNGTTTTWGPSNESVGAISAGAGIIVSSSGNAFTVVNTGDTNSSDDITTTSTAGGDVSGTFSNLQLVANAVSTTELANASVTAAKLASMGAQQNQILRYSSTSGWYADWDWNNTYQAGNGIWLSGNTIYNTGDLNGSDDLLFTTNFSGDVYGTYSSMTVASLQNRPISTNAPATGQVLGWSGSQWIPTWPSSNGIVSVSAGTGISVNSVGTYVTVTNTGDTNASDDFTYTTINKDFVQLSVQLSNATNGSNTSSFIVPTTMSGYRLVHVHYQIVSCPSGANIVVKTIVKRTGQQIDLAQVDLNNTCAGESWVSQTLQTNDLIAPIIISATGTGAGLSVTYSFQKQ